MNGNTPNNFSEFIFFAPNTRGKDGRKVYIDPNLLLPFLDLIDINTNTGVKIARSINGKLAEIKNQAGNIQAQTNVKKPGMHRSNLGPVQITYTIEQAKTANNRGDGVYVTDITSLDIGPTGKAYSTRPGFYLVANTRGQWGTDASSQISKMTTLVGAIGAKMENNYFSAKVTAEEYGDYIHDAGANNEDKYSLLYTPSYILDSLGTWHTPEQKQLPSGTQQIKFAHILLESVKQGGWDIQSREKHLWYVFDGGAKFLEEALIKYQGIAGGQSLEKHEFQLVNPKVNMGPLLKQLEKVKAKVAEKFYHLDEIPAKAHQVLDVDALPHSVAPTSSAYTKLHALDTKIKQYFPIKDPDITFYEIFNEITADLSDNWS